MSFSIKFNWGSAIVLVIAFFMLFILYFVYRMSISSVDLVSTGYYESGIQYDKKKTKMQAVEALIQKPTITLSANAFKTIFPHNIKCGMVTLYRPGNKALDKQWKLSEPTDHFEQTSLSLEPGLWKVLLDWEANGVGYYMEAQYTITP